jgi:hypothetical protein
MCSEQKFSKQIKCCLLCIGLFLLHDQSFSMDAAYRQSADDLNKMDSLPSVLTGRHEDFIYKNLRQEASVKFNGHQLPASPKEWITFKTNLRIKIIQKAHVVINHQLPLNIRETGAVQMKGYSIKKIAFQTRPGVYATANLYVPDGKGPFPAVIHTHGHWTDAKADENTIQPVCHSLAKNGYVCLVMDAFGAGERSTIHGKPEYHGSNLGASLMNIGESLMGMQISDNIRGIDLLCSLPYVDAKKIGATGASGGGNQTMWLTAMDERIKAAVPVVSVGTFEAYIMRSNCICELLIDGLTFTEEAGVLALIAPRAIKMCNHYKDDNPTFVPSEMLRSYNKVKPVFQMLGAANNISYYLSDSAHGYWPDDRQAMLGWFDLHLKGIGNGEPKKEISFETLPPEKLMVYPKGKRDEDVLSTEAYCKQKGTQLRNQFLAKNNFTVAQKRKELRAILRIDGSTTIKTVQQHSNENGWEKIVLETSDGTVIPLRLSVPSKASAGYTIICHSNNKPAELINELRRKGEGIAVVDLLGTGEASSPIADTLIDEGMPFHTISRAELWLGRTVMGEWVKELNTVVQFLQTKYKVQSIRFDGSKEAALAGLFLNALHGDVDRVVLRDAPVSYLFDNRETVDFYNMAIHLPGFLNWGEVSLAAALSGRNVQFIHPLTMSGQAISKNKLKEYQAEFDSIRKRCHQPGKTLFN